MSDPDYPSGLDYLSKRKREQSHTCKNLPSSIHIWLGKTNLLMQIHTQYEYYIQLCPYCGYKPQEQNNE